MSLPKNKKLPFEYRVLSREEIRKLAQIDRAERVENVHYIREGKLTLKKETWDVEDWSDQEKQIRIARLQKLYDDGYTLFGAFDRSTLVGMSLSDPNPLPSTVGRFNFGDYG